ncbi:hypothetical protein [Enterobacter roggenkampii]|uniref:hypothetical protein n=1 Tax=Enterobacter roggenkampii TaxID=1812935 RepID=UPI003D788E83
MSRADFRRPISNHINSLRQVLSAIPADKRLHVIAEALYDLNPTGEEEVSRASCGCYEWDISMDYRNADVRYPQKENPEGEAV